MSKFKIVCPSCGADPYVNEEDSFSYLAKTCPKCGANVFDFSRTTEWCQSPFEGQKLLLNLELRRHKMLSDELKKTIQEELYNSEQDDGLKGIVKYYKEIYLFIEKETDSILNNYYME